MTTQEAYERMRVYFSRPGAKRAITDDPADDDHTLCCYRTEDGAACAVGCLIPDELYDPAIERASATCLLTGSVNERDEEGGALANKIPIPQITQLLAQIDPKFLDEAQTLHDRDHHSYYDEAGDWMEERNTPALFISNLDALAETFDLDITRARALCVAAHPED